MTKALWYVGPEIIESNEWWRKFVHFEWHRCWFDIRPPVSSYRLARVCDVKYKKCPFGKVRVADWQRFKPITNPSCLNSDTWRKVLRCTQELAPGSFWVILWHGIAPLVSITLTRFRVESESSSCRQGPLARTVRPCQLLTGKARLLAHERQSCTSSSCSRRSRTLISGPADRASSFKGTYTRTPSGAYHWSELCLATLIDSHLNLG